jgi:hypothetical protein
MKDTHQSVLGQVIERAINEIAQKGDWREDHQDKNLEALERAVLQEEEHYD